MWLPGLQQLPGLPGELLCRLAPIRINQLHEASHIVQRARRSKPRHLRKRLPTDRTRALKVALLGVGAGKDGVALHACAQVRWVAELDRPDREPLSLTGTIQ